VPPHWRDAAARQETIPMCGRYVLYGPSGRLIESFSIRELPDFGPRYNVASKSPILIIRQREGERVAELMRWACATTR
jgi:putative SOS response-associated peptidase YedK